MKFRYTRYTGEDLEGIDLEELVSQLSKLLLSSGFNSPHSDPFGADDEEEGRPIQDLHDAILESLLTGGLLSDDTISRLLGDPADADQEPGQSPIEQLIQQIIERMRAAMTRVLDELCRKGELHSFHNHGFGLRERGLSS